MVGLSAVVSPLPFKMLNPLVFATGDFAVQCVGIAFSGVLRCPVTPGPSAAEGMLACRITLKSLELYN